MTHPFFGEPSYPWGRSEAVRFYKDLVKAVPNYHAINLLYQTSGAGLPHLMPLPRAEDVWQEALQNLTTAGALRRLCEHVLNEDGLKNIHPSAQAIMSANEVDEQDQIDEKKFVDLISAGLSLKKAQAMVSDYAVRTEQITIEEGLTFLQQVPGGGNSVHEIISWLFRDAQISYSRKKELWATCMTWCPGRAKDLKYNTGLSWPKTRVQTQDLEDFPTRLVGRENEMALLAQHFLLKNRRVVVEGMPGSGKTHLVREFVLRCGFNDDMLIISKPFESIVWIDAKLHNDMGRMLDEIARPFYVTTVLDQDVRERAKTIQRLLTDNRTLVVIDNFELVSSEGIIDLLVKILAGNESCLIIITRQWDHMNLYFKPVMVSGLPEDDAVDFIHELAIPALRDKAGSEFLPLVRAAQGNPYVIMRSLGKMSFHQIDLQDIVLQLHEAGPKVQDILEELNIDAWNQLTTKCQSEISLRALLVIPLFEVEFSKEAILAVSDLGVDNPESARALNDLLKFMILQNISGNYFKVHLLTRQFLRKKIESEEGKKFQEFLNNARIRRARYYEQHLNKYAIRFQPDESYWNALVNEKMDLIDIEFENIKRVLDWANKNKPYWLMKMMLMLVHYMDSRNHDDLRLSYCIRAAEFAQQMSSIEQVAPERIPEYQRYEALFRIDALAWTYLEESLPDLAKAEIDKGFEIIQRMETSGDVEDNATQLRGLGLGWKAVVMMEEGKEEEAEALMKQATSMRGLRPVYKYRIALAKSIVSLLQHNYEAALDALEEAEKQANEYGGEGNRYQTAPRKGLCYLAMGNDSGAWEEFSHLMSHKERIAQLSAQYGLGLVTFYRTGNNEDLVKARDILSIRTSKSNLFKLMDQLYRRLHTKNSEEL